MRNLNGDQVIRAATAAAVVAVAGFAAIVSFSHIYDLGRLHGQSGTAARLLPLSVDGLILAASLVLLHEARNQRPAPLLARAMLGLGVGATVAANVGYGLPYGVTGAVVSAWPAVAFVGAVEMLMSLVRTARRAVPPGVPAAAANGHKPFVPGVRVIKPRYGASQATANKMRRFANDVLAGEFRA